VLLKAFTQLLDARKSRFAPNTPDPLCAKSSVGLTLIAIATGPALLGAPRSSVIYLIYYIIYKIF